MGVVEHLVAAVAAGAAGGAVYPLLRRIDRAYPPIGLVDSARDRRAARWLCGSFPAVAAILGARLGLVARLPPVLYLAAVGTVLVCVDIRSRRLPDRLTLPSYPVLLVLLGVAAAVERASRPLLHAIIAMVVVGLIYAVLSLASGGAGIGLGDAKVAGLLGLTLGWWGTGPVIYGLLIVHTAAGVFGLGLGLTGRAGRGSTIALGPFLIGGWALAVVIFG